MNSIKTLLPGATILTVFATLGWMMPAGAQSGAGKGYSAIPSDGYSVFAEVRAKPGKADELRSVTLPLIAQFAATQESRLFFSGRSRIARPPHFL